MSTSTIEVLIINDLIEVTDYFVNMCDMAGIAISDEVTAKIQHVSTLIAQKQSQQSQQGQGYQNEGRSQY